MLGTSAPGGIVARGFGWRHAGRKLPALVDVTLEIQPGEKVLLVGESGAGKSTLLAAFAGVLGGAEDGDFMGELSVCGVDARDAESLRGKVGMLLQDPDSQVIASKVGDDVAFGCENLGIPREEIWHRVQHSLAAVGLDVPLDHPTSELSGGQKQRLALAGILAMQPEVIVLDEPTANIDPAGVTELVSAVREAVEHTGATLIVVEHRIDVWSSVADRVIVLEAKGAVRCDGALDYILADAANELAQDGIWVPEHLLPAEQQLQSLTRALPRAAAADLTAVQLVSGWTAARPVGPARTLDIPHAVSTVITGRNGAGKSTLALTLAGLLDPLSGSVAASDDIRAGLSASPHRWTSKQLAQRIGFVFQDPEHQFLAGTVRDELVIAAAHAQRRHAWGSWRSSVTAQLSSRADDLLARLRLEHLAAASPFSLSGGQKRRLSVATALMMQPQVLFLDEPTFGQDRRTFIEIVRLLQQLRDEGTTLVSISHDPTFVQLLGENQVELV
ncbi:ATP-binding cassette domain-containing protein [Staphylococcus chromogenes]|nr:ATP-binding cassette domain-containing protein [Staphylococcus chromogenes]